MLHLIKMWLEAPVEETDERGKKHRTTRNKDEARGTPQGAPISPLLSNLYMRRFILGWKQLGHEKRLGAKIVNYADDFVICCRGTAHKAMEAMQVMMKRLKLTVNDAKTHICSMPDAKAKPPDAKAKPPHETFDFLGYTFGRCYSWRDARPFIGTKPSKKRVARICLVISEMTSRGHVRLTAEQMAVQLNRVMVGWANYFCRGPVSHAYQSVDRHARHRLRQWLRAKHGEPRIDYRKYSDDYVNRELGLVRLASLRRNFPCATT